MTNATLGENHAGEARLVRGHENGAVVRSFYTAFETADYERQVRGFLAEGVRWHVAGNNRLAGDFIGIDAVLEAMRQFGEYSNHTLKLATESVFADEHHVVAIHHATAHREGFAYRAHEIDVFHVSGGLITEFWSFSEDQDVTDTLWS